MSLKSLLNPNYFHLSFSITITVPHVTCAHLTSQGHRDALCIAPKRKKGLLQSGPSGSHSHRERLRGFLFYLSLEMTWEAHSPQSAWRSSNADLKAYIWSCWVWKFLSNKNPLVRPTLIRESLTKSAVGVKWKVLSPGVTPRWKETCCCQ